jgi:hypothetical protein
MTSQLAVDALANAVALRHPAGTVVHSDRGSQFRSHAFVRTLQAAGLHGSMGRVGACADNAAMESFFSLLQKNVLNRRQWTTRDELRLAIVTWIERTIAANAKTLSVDSHPSSSRYRWRAVGGRAGAGCKRHALAARTPGEDHRAPSIPVESMEGIHSPGGR